MRPVLDDHLAFAEELQAVPVEDPLMADAGVDPRDRDAGPAERQRMRANATPQPFQTYRQPLHVTRTRQEGYGQALIARTDGGFTIAQIEELIAAGVPAFQALGKPGWRFYEIPTGHWPMLSAPNQLADALLEFAAG